MRLHVAALPHTQVTRAYDWCAYTAKVRRLGGMLEAHGHQMLCYSRGDSQAAGEHVRVGNPEQWNHQEVFGDWEPTSERWQSMNRRTIDAMKPRVVPGDAIGIIAGRCQQQIADAFPNNPILEWGVGYEGVLSNSFRAFESRAWQHYVAGSRHDDDGRFFDTVIPNAFDIEDFTSASEAGEYLLFMGRLTPRKGLAIVEELAQRYPVIVAGQGDIRIPGTEHVGVVLGSEKAQLLANARAVLVPTTYLEPFGGVAVEAMLSGTPVITTDFGAFTETVLHGVSGFRCSTLGEFIAAVENCDELKLNARAIWEHANQYTTDRVAPLYDAWLRRIDLLHHDGWYSLAA